MSVAEEPYDLNLVYHPPNDLIYFNNATAINLLLEPSTVNSHFFTYETGLDTQVNQAYCAVATSASMLNSLRFLHEFDLPVDRIYAPYPYATQHDLFDACVGENVIKVKPERDGILTDPFGLSLDQAAILLECHLTRDISGGNWEVDARHVDPASWSLDLMRQEMIDILSEDNGRVAINYDRATLGQVGGGHFSPLGAYNPQTDSFLILDVAKYKYPPVWAPAKYLFASMATVDSCGIWNYPNAQSLLPDGLSHESALKFLGCRPAFRGYLMVKKET